MCKRIKEGEARVHGMQCPLHPYQILVWTTIIVSIILFVTIVVPYHPGDLHLWIPSGIYGGLWIVGCSNFLWLSLTDPKTRRVKGATTEMQTIEGQHAIPMHDPQDTQPELTECTKCPALKLPDTKHCNLCHKCIDGFDHHCVYLNTCIGGKNYWNFFTLITCLTLFFADQLYCTAHWAVQYYLDDADYVNEIDKSHLGGDGHVLLAIITAVIPFLGLCLISSLEGFHILIIVLRTTTYKWIIERRRAKAEAQYKADQKKAEKLKRAAEKAGNKQTAVEMSSTVTTSEDTDNAAYKEWQAKQAKDKEERAKREARFEKEKAREAKRKLLEQKIPESILPTVESQESDHDIRAPGSTQTHSTQPSQSISRLTHKEGDVSIQEDSHTDYEGEGLMEGIRRSASGIHHGSPGTSSQRTSVIVKPSKKQNSETLLRVDEDGMERRLSFLGVASVGETVGDKGGSGEKDAGKEKERRQGWGEKDKMRDELPGGNQSDDEASPERSISLPGRSNSQSLHQSIPSTTPDSPQKD